MAELTSSELDDHLRNAATSQEYWIRNRRNRRANLLDLYKLKKLIEADAANASGSMSSVIQVNNPGDIP